MTIEHTVRTIMFAFDIDGGCCGSLHSNGEEIEGAGESMTDSQMMSLLTFLYCVPLPWLQTIIVWCMSLPIISREISCCH